MCGRKLKVLLVLFLFNVVYAQDTGIIPPEQLKRIEEFKKKLEGIGEKAIERAKNYTGDRIFSQKNTGNIPFLYIFMSSSVPLEVWWNYARYMEENNIKGAFILRGCIGGCRYIRPTLEFIERFLTEDGRNESGLSVEVWIDPLKFREYRISKVPCVAKEGSKEISCGDWNMEYHLRKLGIW